jgi:hypothetical protein
LPRWFSLFDTLPITPALPIAFFFARRCRPVTLLSLPPRPSPRRLPALLAAITLARLNWTKPLVATFNRQRRVRGRRSRCFRPPRSWFGAERVESSTGLTGVWLPESSCPGGDWHPLRRAAGPVQRELKTLSQMARAPRDPSFPARGGAVSRVSPTLAPCVVLKPVPVTVRATGRHHLFAARRLAGRRSGAFSDRHQQIVLQSHVWCRRRQAS